MAKIHAQLLAIHHIAVLGQGNVSHALCDVLGHIARRTATCHALEIDAVGLGTALIAIVTQPVFAQHAFHHLGLRLAFHPHQHVPVRRGIVVRLGHAQAVKPHALAVQL